MSEVRDIQPVGEHRYGVQIVEGQDVETRHLVTVPPALVDDLQLGAVDEAEIVREAVDFVLDREMPTSIPDEVSLETFASAYGEEFYAELRERLAR